MSSAVSMSFSLPPAPPPTTTSAPTTANSSNANSANSGSPQATYKVPKFLRSLYSILQNEDASVVTWLQNQELKPNRVTAFHILDLDRFEHHVLPKYFKHSKFASFQRQLNNFGFRKWTKTQSSGVCTFSHNCFPPDPREIGVLRASIREQWRQKNTDTRRRVGNGITKAERKLQQQVQQQVQQLQLPVTKPSTSNTADSKKLLDSPSPSPAPSSNSNSNNSMASPTRVESFSEMLKTPLAPTHQPQVKKLARGDWTSSSNSNSDAFKPSTLPHVSFNNTVNIGSSVAPPPPVVYHCPPPPPMLMIPNAEPWAWHPSMAYEVQPFQYAAHVDHHSHQQQHQHQHHAWAGALRKPFAEQQVSPSTMEEFTFDSLLLFAE